jgi:hypothetical protein
MMIASDLATCGVIAALAVIDAGGGLTFPLLAGPRLPRGAGRRLLLFRRSAGSCRSSSSPRRSASANTLIGVSRWGSILIGPFARRRAVQRV